MGLVIAPIICLQAAEAIEDLQKQISISEANNIKLTRLLEEAYNPPT